MLGEMTERAISSLTFYNSSRAQSPDIVNVGVVSIISPLVDSNHNNYCHTHFIDKKTKAQGI